MDAETFILSLSWQKPTIFGSAKALIILALIASVQCSFGHTFSDKS
jgi:hypothetical protein